VHLGLGIDLGNDSVASLRSILDLFVGGVRHLCVWPEQSNIEAYLHDLAICGVPFVSFSGGEDHKVDMRMIWHALRDSGCKSTLRGISMHTSLRDDVLVNIPVAQLLDAIADDNVFPLLESIVVRQSLGVHAFCMNHDGGVHETDRLDYAFFNLPTTAQDQAILRMGIELDPPQGFEFDLDADVVRQKTALAALARRSAADAQRRLSYLMIAGVRANQGHPLKNSMMEPFLKDILDFAQDGRLAHADEKEWSSKLDDMYWFKKPAWSYNAITGKARNFTDQTIFGRAEITRHVDVPMVAAAAAVGVKRKEVSK